MLLSRARFDHGLAAQPTADLGEPQVELLAGAAVGRAPRRRLLFGQERADPLYRSAALNPVRYQQADAPGIPPRTRKLSDLKQRGVYCIPACASGDI
jgi:hypothetical protein